MAPEPRIIFRIFWSTLRDDEYRENRQRIGEGDVDATVVVYGRVGVTIGRVEDGRLIEDAVLICCSTDGRARIPFRCGDGEEKRCVLNAFRKRQRRWGSLSAGEPW